MGVRAPWAFRHELPVESDEQLTERAREGDQSAYGELYRRHRKAAESTAWCLLRSKNDADDEPDNEPDPGRDRQVRHQRVQSVAQGLTPQQRTPGGYLDERVCDGSQRPCDGVEGGRHLDPLGEAAG